VDSLLILTAIELEARALARELELPRLGEFPFPVFGRGPVRLAPVGVRATRCESRWDRLLAGLAHPSIASAGVCGGLDPRLESGALVVPRRVACEGGAACEIAPGGLGAGPVGMTIHDGLLLTTREIVATRQAKAALFAATGAIAVDMESAIIVARAARAGLPALVVRAVADHAGLDLPPALDSVVTPEGRIRLARAVALGLTRPAVLPRAIDLGRRTRRALASVARALAALIG